MESHDHAAPAAPQIAPGKVRFGILFAICALAGVFIFGYLPKRANRESLDSTATQISKAVLSVNVSSPHIIRDAGSLLPGSITAIDAASVGARASGYVSKRYVDIGSRVKEGDVLAEIESPDVDQQLAQAESDAVKSVATVGQSQADVLRLRAGVSQAQSDSARQLSAVKQAQAQQLGTESKVAQAQAGELTAEAQHQQKLQALEVQKANLLQMQSQLDLARSTDDRYENLLKQGFVAEQDVDEQRANLRNALANVKASQSSIKSAQADVDAAEQGVRASQADVKSAESDVDAAEENVAAARSALNSTVSNVRAARAGVTSSEAIVRANQAAVNSSNANTKRIAVLRSFEKVVAPFSGVITARYVDTGALVKADNDTTGTAHGLFDLDRTDILRIQVNVPQSLVNAVKPGQPATVLIHEFPGRVFKGNVFQSAGGLDPATRTMLTEVHIPNPNNLLRPGMYAEVQFAAPALQTSPRVPADTIVFNADGTRVVSVTPDNKVHYIPVVIGRDFGKDIEIRQGIVGNERLVDNPTDTLKEGMTVQPIVDSDADAPAK